MHRANQILDAIVAAVTGLATTGSNVVTTRGYPIDDPPGITVRAASLDPVNEITAFLDSILEVEIVYHVAGEFEDLDAQVFQIDAEAYAAIMADRTLGGFAVDVDPATLSIDSDASGEVPTASGVRRWRVRLRHSITDTEA